MNASTEIIILITNERQVFGNNFLSTEQIVKFITEERK